VPRKPEMRDVAKAPARIAGAQWVALTRGRWALVDDEDYELVKAYTWYFNPSSGNTGYAATTKRVSGLNVRTYMHRLITGYDRVDHQDRNKLNNRRSNLRSCTQSQNLANRPMQHNNKSGYRGVSWFRRDDKWRVTIKVLSKQIHIGYFFVKEEAAKAYDRAALKHFGEYAQLNFPGRGQ